MIVKRSEKVTFISFRHGLKESAIRADRALSEQELAGFAVGGALDDEATGLVKATTMQVVIR